MIRGVVRTLLFKKDNMSRKLRNVAALCVTLASAGCMQITEPIHRPLAPIHASALRQSASRAEAPLRLPRLSTSAEVGERSIVTGSLLNIVLSVTNHQREPVTLSFAATCQLLFVVYDQHGTRVSENWGCATFPTTLTLGPRETVRRTSVWLAARYNYAQGGYVPLPAGTYRIHAYISGHGYQSPPFVLRLLAREPGGGP